MIIKSVKFYQGIKFAGDTLTFVNLETENDKQTRLGLDSLSLEESDNGIFIKKGNLAVLATWNNIQYAEYEIPAKKETSKAK